METKTIKILIVIFCVLCMLSALGFELYKHIKRKREERFLMQLMGINKGTNFYKYTNAVLLWIMMFAGFSTILPGANKSIVWRIILGSLYFTIMLFISHAMNGLINKYTLFNRYRTCKGLLITIPFTLIFNIASVLMISYRYNVDNNSSLWLVFGIIAVIMCVCQCLHFKYGKEDIFN